MVSSFTTLKSTLGYFCGNEGRLSTACVSLDDENSLV